LLEDVRTGKIDIIVVYKVDRLTRSLADFAKLVELFDQHKASFVSVTQQFNTTTSMGRLWVWLVTDAQRARMQQKIETSSHGTYAPGRSPWHPPGLELQQSESSRLSKAQNHVATARR